MKRIISGVLRLFLAAFSIVLLYDTLKHFYFIQSMQIPNSPKKFQNFERSENISDIIVSLILLNIIIYLSVNAIRDFRSKSIILWPLFVISFIAVFIVLVMRLFFGFQFDQMSIYELIFTFFSLIVTMYFMVHDYILLFWIKRKVNN